MALTEQLRANLRRLVAITRVRACSEVRERRADHPHPLFPGSDWLKLSVERSRAYSCARPCPWLTDRPSLADTGIREEQGKCKREVTPCSP